MGGLGAAAAVGLGVGLGYYFENKNESTKHNLKSWFYSNIYQNIVNNILINHSTESTATFKKILRKLLIENDSKPNDVLKWLKDKFGAVFKSKRLFKLLNQSTSDEFNNLLKTLNLGELLHSYIYKKSSSNFISILFKTFEEDPELLKLFLEYFSTLKGVNLKNKIIDGFDQLTRTDNTDYDKIKRNKLTITFGNDIYNILEADQIYWWRIKNSAESLSKIFSKYSKGYADVNFLTDLFSNFFNSQWSFAPLWFSSCSW
ncbi:hypothetical protein QLQ80_03210 [Mycoplasma sp. M5725]|uniref:Uncharacterized protein n=1 Tax=Mycoplasma phocimorsus TaxID=3045839 RepID=A0AAJ1PTU4_9MOLU|nr:hypothetical protein [Mycoplasma phocimorsus]MDJ1646072.1 hypothetical protein [Mycoplasma phocimorsus]